MTLKQQLQKSNIISKNNKENTEWISNERINTYINFKLCWAPTYLIVAVF